MQAAFPTRHGRRRGCLTAKPHAGAGCLSDATCAATAHERLDALTCWPLHGIKEGCLKNPGCLVEL